MVATNYNIPFFPEEAKEFRPNITVPEGKVISPVYQVKIEEINRWLNGIPLDKRVFDVKSYKVKKK